ncbi:MAG TPA: hypothetical protein VHZ27_03655 [Solirubrobacteraceae bacterium]|nr:hypothetical protein [Solirubrobacteraceae bacterium]
MPPHKHQVLLTAAIEREGEAQHRLLAGDLDAARAEFAAAAELYRQSWESAHARAFGRLVGMLKASVLAGEGSEEAEYVRAALGERDPESPTASYAQALAALILGEDQDARLWAARMSPVGSAGGGAGGGGGTDAFARTGEAVSAIASDDGERYAVALAAIVLDFEQRSEHLTGVAIADTALMLEALAARRGMRAAVESPVLPVGLVPPS